MQKKSSEKLEKPDINTTTYRTYSDGCTEILLVTNDRITITSSTGNNNFMSITVFGEVKCYNGTLGIESINVNIKYSDGTSVTKPSKKIVKQDLQNATIMENLFYVSKIENYTIRQLEFPFTEFYVDTGKIEPFIISARNVKNDNDLDLNSTRLFLYLNDENCKTFGTKFFHKKNSASDFKAIKSTKTINCENFINNVIQTLNLVICSDRGVSNVKTYQNFFSELTNLELQNYIDTGKIFEDFIRHYQNFHILEILKPYANDRFTNYITFTRDFKTISSCYYSPKDKTIYYHLNFQQKNVKFKCIINNIDDVYQLNTGTMLCIVNNLNPKSRTIIYSVNEKICKLDNIKENFGILMGYFHFYDLFSNSSNKMRSCETANINDEIKGSVLGYLSDNLDNLLSPLINNENVNIFLNEIDNKIDMDKYKCLVVDSLLNEIIFSIMQYAKSGNLVKSFLPDEIKIDLIDKLSSDRVSLLGEEMILDLIKNSVLDIISQIYEFSNYELSLDKNLLKLNKKTIIKSGNKKYYENTNKQIENVDQHKKLQKKSKKEGQKVKKEFEKTQKQEEINENLEKQEKTKVPLEDKYGFNTKNSFQDPKKATSKVSFASESEKETNAEDYKIIHEKELVNDESNFIQTNDCLNFDATVIEHLLSHEDASSFIGQETIPTDNPF